MRQYRNLIITSVLLAGLLAFAGYYYQSVAIPPASNNTAPVSTSTAISALPAPSTSFTLILDLTSGQKSLQEEFNVGANLFDILKAVAVAEGIEIKFKEYQGMGFLVDSIGGDKNGTGGKYWQFWINGKYATVGASSYKVQPGDVIEWKFTKDQ